MNLLHRTLTGLRAGLAFDCVRATPNVMALNNTLPRLLRPTATDQLLCIVLEVRFSLGVRFLFSRCKTKFCFHRKRNVSAGGTCLGNGVEVACHFCGGGVETVSVRRSCSRRRKRFCGRRIATALTLHCMKRAAYFAQHDVMWLWSREQAGGRL